MLTCLKFGYPCLVWEYSTDKKNNFLVAKIKIAESSKKAADRHFQTTW